MLHLEPSRLLWVWWCLLHLLLAAAAALVGWPAPVTWLVVAAVAGHALLRRPSLPPTIVVVAEGGACAIPEWRTGLRPLGPRTLVCPLWIELDLGDGLDRRYILLLADQVGADEWRRLRAILARARGD